MARKQKTIHYIYKTTCLVTNRYYIGMHSTNNLEDGYMGSGLRLRRSIRKYGVENHVKEILEYCVDVLALSKREAEIVTHELINEDLCMNLVAGGYGGFISKEGCTKGGKVSGDIIKQRLETNEEFKIKHKANFVLIVKKAREENRYPNNSFKDKTHSDETKKLMSEKASERTGNKNSQYGTCWITKEGLNKKIKKENFDQYINEGWITGRQ
jgi:hypothetical protein